MQHFTGMSRLRKHSQLSYARDIVDCNWNGLDCNNDMLTNIQLKMDCCFVADINECDSHPCTNGATCIDEVNAYKCTCVDSYTGTNCEIGMF